MGAAPTEGADAALQRPAGGGQWPPTCPLPSPRAPPALLQEAWLAAALGGPAYSGPDPAALFSSLASGKGLKAEHLDLMAAHLADAMQHLGMPQVMQWEG